MALGPLAIATMQGIRVRKAILGAGGIVAEGIYNSNLLLVETERQMMACGQEVVIVADHTKFGRLALARLCGLDEVDRLVVDPGLPDEYRAMLEAAGVTLHVAAARRRRDGNGPPSRPRQRARGAKHEHRSLTPARPGREPGPLDPPAAARRTAGRATARPAYRPNLVANISARHCHLTQADVDVLFGEGYQLTRDEDGSTRRPTSPRTRRWRWSALGSG